MSGLRRYIEWMSRGRRTDRIAYVMKEWDLPVPLPGAEWQLDASFNAGDEILRDPELAVYKARLKKRQACHWPRARQTEGPNLNLQLAILSSACSCSPPLAALG
jgi:hypothetical protein